MGTNVMNYILLPIMMVFSVFGAQLTDTVKTEASQKYLPPRPAEYVTDVLPQNIIDLLLKSDVVDCALLCGEWKLPCDPVRKHHLLDPYVVRVEGGKLNDRDREELISIITNPKSYLVYQTPGDGKLCMCSAHIAYMFARFNNQGKKRYQAVIQVCHDCSAIVVQVNGGRLFIDIDYSAERFLDLTIRLFPGDSLTTVAYERYHSTR